MAEVLAPIVGDRAGISGMSKAVDCNAAQVKAISAPLMDANEMPSGDQDARGLRKGRGNRKAVRRKQI
jgi:hypothetical protein